MADRFANLANSIILWSKGSEKPVWVTKDGLRIPSLDFNFTFQPRSMLFDNLSELVVRTDTIIQDRIFRDYPIVDEAIQRLQKLRDAVYVLYNQNGWCPQRTVDAYNRLVPRLAAAITCLQDVRVLTKVSDDILVLDMKRMTLNEFMDKHSEFSKQIASMRQKQVPEAVVNYPGLVLLWTRWHQDSLNIAENIQHRWSEKIIHQWLVWHLKNFFAPLQVPVDFDKLTATEVGRAIKQSFEKFLEVWLIGIPDAPAKLYEFGVDCRFFHDVMHYESPILLELADFFEKIPEVHSLISHDLATIASLKGAYGNFSPDGADMCLLYKECRIPVHHNFLVRFAVDFDTQWQFLLRHPQTELKLPDDLPFFDDVTVGCLVRLIYGAPIPKTIQKGYHKEICNMLSYLCALENPKDAAERLMLMLSH